MLIPMDPWSLSIPMYLGLPLLLGTGILACLGIYPRADRLSYLGWAWMSGCLGSGLLLAAWLCCSPSSMGAALPAALLAGAAGLCWLLARTTRLRTAALPPTGGGSRVHPAESWFFGAAILFVLLVTLERVLFGSLHAVLTTDEASFWSFRAKVLFHAGGFGQAYAEGIRETRQSNADYPLLNPLLQLWVYVTHGGITHLANRMIILAMLPALVLVLAGAMRRWVRPAVAGLFLLLLCNMKPYLFATAVGYSDVMVGLGTLVILDAALRWSQEQRRAWLWLASLGLAFVLASKNDGMMVALALLGALLSSWLWASRSVGDLLRMGKLLCYAVPGLLIYGLGKLHNRFFQFKNIFFEQGRDPGSSAEAGSGLWNALSALPSSAQERLLPILEYFGSRIFFAWDHSSFLLAAFVLLALGFLIKGLGPALHFGASFVGLLLLGLISVFITLPFELDYHLSTAASRIMIAVLPAAMLWLAALAGGWFGLARASGSTSSEAGQGKAHPILRALFLIYLGLGAGVSLVAGVQRLALHGPASFDKGIHWSEERRIKNGLVRADSRAKLEKGVFGAVRAALLKHVPETGQVMICMPEDSRAKIAQTMLSLTYPRRFLIGRPRPDGKLTDGDMQPLVGQAWVLDLLGVETQLERHFQVLEKGPGWSLWR